MVHKLIHLSLNNPLVVVFLVLVLAVIVLTIVGTFLRGPYWHFFWPWETWPETPKHF